MAEPSWSITGWSAEYRQVGPFEYRYKIRDPEGKVWRRQGQWEFIAGGSQAEAMAEMKEKAKSFATVYASEKAPVQVYTFFDDDHDPRADLAE